MQVIDVVRPVECLFGLLVAARQFDVLRLKPTCSPARLVGIGFIVACGSAFLYLIALPAYQALAGGTDGDQVSGAFAFLDGSASTLLNLLLVLAATSVTKMTGSKFPDWSIVGPTIVAVAALFVAATEGQSRTNAQTFDLIFSAAALASITLAVWRSGAKSFMADATMILFFAAAVLQVFFFKMEALPHDSTILLTYSISFALITDLAGLAFASFLIENW